MDMKISVVINTYNEGKHIYDCLSCVPWANEVILVDMYSEDNTVAIAKEFPNVKIFYHEKCGYVEPARQFAIEKANNNWIMILDADERVSHGTVEYIEQIIKLGEIDIICLPRYNYIMGELLYCGYQSNEILPRCFKKGAINFTTAIHQGEIAASSSRKFKIQPFQNIMNPAKHVDITQYIGILHFAADDFELRIDKINRYTTIEAINIYENKKKNTRLWRIIFNYPYRLLGNIIWRKGYKQLSNQLMLITTMLFYELATYMKLYYMKKYKSIDYTQKIDESYKEMSKKLINEYNS